MPEFGFKKAIKLLWMPYGQEAGKPGCQEAFSYLEPPSFTASQPQAVLKYREDFDFMINL
jgi:hypothetical protein